MWTGTDGGKGWGVGLVSLVTRCVLLALLGVAAGCGPGEAKAPIPTRPLDERRAIEVIRRSIKDAGVDPDSGRDEPIANAGKPLHIDVGVKGHAYGIAYITSEDADALGSAIPSPNNPDEKLKLVRCGDGETHVVLLYQQNYRYDDLTGEAHEKTTITAEGALARDVRDFVTYARSKKFE
jgi:hypothetical protein